MNGVVLPNLLVPIIDRWPEAQKSQPVYWDEIGLFSWLNQVLLPIFWNKVKWGWIKTYYIRFGVDEHPFASYFDVHQSPSVLSPKSTRGSNMFQQNRLQPTIAGIWPVKAIPSSPVEWTRWPHPKVEFDLFKRNMVISRDDIRLHSRQENSVTIICQKTSPECWRVARC